MTTTLPEESAALAACHGKIIDTLMALPFPKDAATQVYKSIVEGTKDSESAELEMPAGYMFKDPPAYDGSRGPVAEALDAMDRAGIAQGLFQLGRDYGGAETLAAIREHPDRMLLQLEVDPSDVMGTLREIDSLAETERLVALGTFPAGTGVPIDDRLMYPIYARCVELEIPFFSTAGVPGPRRRLSPQKVERIDDVMYDFPDLTFVMRHGAEPWEDLAVKLLLKWPNLYYSTSAFAPRYYPRSVVDFANTRGANKVLYAGYYPFGLGLDRIMAEMPLVPFRDHVWPKFLYENARTVLRLDRWTAQ